ncbi:hypothetical protein UFOVP434_45 [uncultured Caudovirales phage]|uniref:Uncharacterized protein n=1 Tax=uncultured Caudovirales phage TaxID=2100421 RepID=A0A6J5MC41_9CAUD|nr:hypothetical protein UFOVP434_45 [uncultured Caudovirales phage]
MPELFANNAQTTIIAPMTAAQTTVQVASNDGFPAVTTASGNFFYSVIDAEIVKVTDNSTVIWIIERGNQATIPATHAANTVVSCVITKQTMVDIQAAASTGGSPSLVGLYSALPAAGETGRIYYPTDRIYTYRDNGTSWDAFYLNRPVTPPPSESTFGTWINQGSATATDVGGTIVLDLPTSASNNLRGKVKAYSAPKTIEMGYLYQGNITNFFSGGIMIGSAGATLLQVGTATSSGNITVGSSKYNSPTSYNSGYAITPYTWFPMYPYYVLYQDDGVNRITSMSFDGGVTYTQVHSVVRTDFLTPTTVGFGFETINSGSKTRSIIFHWKET